MENSGIIPTMDYSRTNNDGMFGGEWAWILVILFAFGGFGFGNRNNALETDIDTRFLERDIFNTNQNVSNTACQTQRDVLENRFTAERCCCETQKEILQNRYDNALQTQTLSSQMANCCCDLKAEGISNTQKILDKLCENEINGLRDRLNERDRELQSAQLQISQLAQTANITNTLRPFPQPAYITCSPYQSYPFNGCGCNNGCGNATII